MRWEGCKERDGQDTLPPAGRHAYSPRAHSARTAGTSGRGKSGGGGSPRPNSSRTRVPESPTRSSTPCGHVLAEATASHRRQKKVSVKKSGSIPSSSLGNERRRSCAAYGA